MKLTRRQRFQLRLYVHFRDRDMSIRELFWLNRWIYFILIPSAALTALVPFFVFGAVPAIMVLVWYTALIVRDLGQFIRARNVWPVHRELLDWAGIDRLLREDSAHIDK